MAGAGGDWKALFEAASRGDLEEVRLWLAAGVDPDFQHVEVGTTPLIAAAEGGHRAAVEALLEAGASPGLRSLWERHTAAEAARAAGHELLARWLEARAAPKR